MKSEGRSRQEKQGRNVQINYARNARLQGCCKLLADDVDEDEKRLREKVEGLK